MRCLFFNSLFLQSKNNYYIICLNKVLLLSNNSSVSFSKNIYVFLKYNFFNFWISDSFYVYLDRFIISNVVKDIIIIIHFYLNDYNKINQFMLKNFILVLFYISF